MIALDASVLIDHLDGEPAAEAFVDQHQKKQLYAPTFVLYEVYRGGARAISGDRRGAVRDLVDGLGWLEPLEFNQAAAAEAALVEAELLDAGDEINTADVVIAGTCRHHGADLATGDSHFDHVDELGIVDYPGGA